MRKVLGKKMKKKKKKKNRNFGICKEELGWHFEEEDGEFW